MKIVNLVLGIATTVILAALITLGIKAFYPAPEYPTYLNPPVPVAPCATNDTKCITAQTATMQQQQEQQAQYDKAEQAYEAASRVRNRNVFIIANIIGIIMFALGFWIIFGTAIVSQAVPIGIMLAGLWSIIYGYGNGWDSTNDQLKFFIGLAIAALVIGGSVWLMQRYQDKLAK